MSWEHEPHQVMLELLRLFSSPSFDSSLISYNLSASSASFINTLLFLIVVHSLSSHLQATLPESGKILQTTDMKKVPLYYAPFSQIVNCRNCRTQGLWEEMAPSLTLNCSSSLVYSLLFLPSQNRPESKQLAQIWNLDVITVACLLKHVAVYLSRKWLEATAAILLSNLSCNHGNRK